MQYFGPFERQSLDSIWAGYVVNLIAPATLMPRGPSADEARGAGQIVNIGSVMGAVNYPHFATYSSSKCGLRGLSEALRRELGHPRLQSPMSHRGRPHRLQQCRGQPLYGGRRMQADDPAGSPAHRRARS